MMNAKRVLLVLGVLALGVAMFFAGSVFAQSGWGDGDERGPADGPAGWGYGMMGGGHMYGWDEDDQGRPFGGMMGRGMMGPGAQRGYGGGMMDPSLMGPMMGGWGGLADVEPLSVEEAEEALADFLAQWDGDDLVAGEIMIFENHAYAQINDAASGEGAFEVLVDPLTGNVYPEPGPNMMWNTEYGHMAGGGMMGGRYGGMMRGWNQPQGDPDVTAGEAVALAQAYLDEVLPGATAGEHADAFPGYYTLHVLRDGQIVGMLSVNAFTGDVFPHTWHGDFVEMEEAHAE